MRVSKRLKKRAHNQQKSATLFTVDEEQADAIVDSIARIFAVDFFIVLYEARKTRLQHEDAILSGKLAEKKSSLTCSISIG